MNETLSQTICDLDEFIQREGTKINREILRSKLRFLLKITFTEKPRTIIRGLLIRLRKLEISHIIIKTIDIINYFQKLNKINVRNRKFTLNRIIKPIDIIRYTEHIEYPLKLEYS